MIRSIISGTAIVQTARQWLLILRKIYAMLIFTINMPAMPRLRNMSSIFPGMSISMDAIPVIPLYHFAICRLAFLLLSIIIMGLFWAQAAKEEMDR